MDIQSYMIEILNWIQKNIGDMESPHIIDNEIRFLSMGRYEMELIINNDGSINDNGDEYKSFQDWKEGFRGIDPELDKNI